VKPLLTALASLRLTVVLFALSIVLVFFGTLALIDNGMWTVIHDYFRSPIVWIRFNLVRQFLTVFFWLPKGPDWPGAAPFPGGLTLGIALLVNMLAAHAVRFKFAWNRVGIITLHAGLIMLLTGELITRFFAVEQKMTLKTGEISNFAYVTEDPELAVTDITDPKNPKVVAVSNAALSRALRTKTPFRHAELPFAIDVREMWINTEFKQFQPGVVPDAGSQFAMNSMGMNLEFKSAKQASGTGSGDDLPSVVVQLWTKDNTVKGGATALGTHFLSYVLDRDVMRRIPAFQFKPATVTAGESTYALEYRPRRIYKPYTIALKQFTHEKYAGTDKAKDFASTVQLVHPDRGENRETRIWMNNPLRYDASPAAGVLGSLKSMNPVWNDSETFFQAGYLPGNDGTVLQVVQNPSWMWPYISCILISLGMTVHFLMVLAKFTTRSMKLRANAVSATPTAVGAVVVPTSGRTLPIAIGVTIAVLCGAYLASKYRLPKPVSGEIDLVAFGQIPVLEGGRIQPLDSFARNALMALCDSEYYDVPRTDAEMAAIGAGERFMNTIRSQDGKTKKRPAIEWLLSVLGSRDAFDSPGAQHRVIRIDSLEVLELLGLEARPGSYRYSPAEIKKNYAKFEVELAQVKKVDADKRDLYQKRIAELGQKFAKYNAIVFLDSPLMLPPTSTGGEWTNFHTRNEELIAPAMTMQTEAFVNGFRQMLAEKYPHLAEGGADPIAGLPKEVKQELFKMLIEKQGVLRKQLSDEKLPTAFPEGQALIDMLDAGRAGKVEEFAAKIAAHREKFGSVKPEDLRRTVAEQTLNAFDPFLNCMVMFVFAFQLGVTTWCCWSLPRVRLGLWTTALGLLIVTLAVQIVAMGMRMYLMDRPMVFVTNLFASAVFIGTCVSLFCIPLELFSRLGIGTVVAATLGYVTTYIARHLQASGDTLEMVVAVLDTNLWLSTHVTTVTLGYAATLVAGAIALLYLGLSAFTPILKGPAGKNVGGMLYGTICFATLLSFVGTVLGGIWADQSWGRFWGWDPKENGALLIVAWNALILHARWAGLVKARGVAILAIAGIAITMWSWFGTNQLGIGLHAYGFNNTLANWCSLTWIGSALVTGFFIAWPESMWVSRQTETKPA
jgi:ABC-type transport system involved in cytochrome c biogenesis permease subunit